MTRRTPVPEAPAPPGWPGRAGGGAWEPARGGALFCFSTAYGRPPLRQNSHQRAHPTAMTSPRPAHRDERPPETGWSQGLRLRLWLGCLAGVLVGAAGMWWVV